MSEKAINVTVSEELSSSRVAPNEGFFHWIQDEESKRTPIAKAKTIPWTGIVALAGSALTAILSCVVLIVVSGRETFPKTGIYTVMQPASWLSALISANSIFLHIALNEGVTIAWWFKATRQSATIKDLHKVWATGTSAKSAITDIKGLNYVSLATIFVAVIPLNGFLLQGALSTPVTTLNNTALIPVPMAKYLQQGYSGYTTSAGSGVGTSKNTSWPVVFQQQQNPGASSFSQYAYFGNYDYWNENENLTLNEQWYNDSHNEKHARYQAKVPGAGFNYTCLKSSKAFDMFPAGVNTSTNATIFDMTVSWDKLKPNTIHLDTYWKSETECSGYYEVRNCTLQAAVVEYPVVVQLNVSGAVAGPYYSLQPGTSRHGDRVVEMVEPYHNEGMFNTTYGGIWISLSKWFGSNVTINNYTQSTGGVRYSEGAFANTLTPNYMGYDQYEAPYVCNQSVSWGVQTLSYFQAFNAPSARTNAEGGWYYYPTFDADATDVVLEQVRQSMFLAAVYSGSQWVSPNYVPNQQYIWDDNSVMTGYWLPSDYQEDYIQYVNSTRFIDTTTYDVRWYLWGASLALTYIIILIVLPTFWGFWILARKPSMSPVDLARAFNAPVVTADEAHQMHVDRLLQEVGSRNIHTMPSRPESMENYLPTRDSEMTPPLPAYHSMTTMRD